MGRPRICDRVDEETIVKVLRETDLNFQEIGQRLGCSASMVGEVNERRSVRPPKLKADKERIIQLLKESDWPLADIASECRCSASVVSRLNKKLGLRAPSKPERTTFNQRVRE